MEGLVPRLPGHFLDDSFYVLHLGELELYRGGAEELAARAQQAGVPVTLQIWPGMWHFWHLFAPFLPEAREAMEAVGEFLSACVGCSS